MSEKRSRPGNPLWRVWVGVAVLASCYAGTAPAEESSPEPIRLIIQADDMAMLQAINAGCIESYRNGIVRTVEVMVSAPWFLDAARLLEENPGLDVGIHLTLACGAGPAYRWRPLTAGRSIADPDGFLHPADRQTPGRPPHYGFSDANPTLEDVERELRAQIELGLKKIPRISHISLHMGTVQCVDQGLALVRRLAKEYKLPMHGLRGVRGLGGVRFVSGGTMAERLAKALEGLTPGTYMLVEHPGLDTPEMRAVSPQMAKDRDEVTKAFTAPEVLAVIKKRGIVLTSVGEQYKRQAKEQEQAKQQEQTKKP